MDKALSVHLQNRFPEYEFRTIKQVYGGDINETYIIDTNKDSLFVKVNRKTKADMFEKEFNGLHLLRSADSILLPKPLIHGNFEENIYLVMECIAKGNVSPGFWKQFAFELASLHKNTNEVFGLQEDNYIGSLPQRNKPHSTWSEFYAAQRVLPLMRIAFDQQKCESKDIKLAEIICNKFNELFPEEPSSLLHGDLWSGNFMVNNEGKAVIYDPAVYYGHREMDIGMTLLFGGFDNSFYDFYNEAYPLQKRWKERIPLTQLYPLLVHLILFGGHYQHSVRNILNRFS